MCTSTDPRNHRNRLGLWLHDANHSIAIDVSSEFRLGALRHGLKHLDAVLLTHAHSDHVSGLDDLRIISQMSGKPVPLYGSSETLSDIRQRFAYAFAAPKGYGGGAPQYDLRVAVEPFDLLGWHITPLPILHGPEKILGYRIGDFALITDVTEIPEATLDLLKGLKVLALDCLRERPHSTHLGFNQSVDYARRIGAEQTYFIHMCHELEHVQTESRLPPEIRLAYDGLEVELPISNSIS